MPDVSGVSDQPSSANQPGSGIRYQSDARRAASRRTPGAPPAATQTASRRAGSRIDQRQVAAHGVGEEPQRFGVTVLPVLLELEPLAAAAATAIAADADVLRLERATNVWCIASAPGGPVRLSAFIALSARTAGLGCAAYATRTGPATAAPSRSCSAIAATASRTGDEAHATHGEECHGRHERQRVTDERRCPGTTR